ncbi:uncharacterized protein B0P05DRAFT_585571 [Gilbertella persicaria]|uniref:Uncharacterized protein n=1 Tax=Rhizopus stolonifer TaxID=4846 RepID=A0A367J2L1_RHIST|nr:uncharacterized protein B0P05DRAFT_585571 [Gilbertella persicaria]KAI8084279.1 hypothetical protein B0P05DRAFT_585571 [Gilbertella persicaria]RCH84178.1 hypothetical protein CU098_008131 [Rhizopus stolonifer]
MDLNLCLYCEKRLADDNMAFCSIPCQSKEASKSMTGSFDAFKSSNTMQYEAYPISYHRSPSLTYSLSSSTISQRKDSADFSIARPPPNYYLVQSTSTTSSSFSSSMSDMSIFLTPCSCEDKVSTLCPPYHITRTTHNIAS